MRSSLMKPRWRGFWNSVTDSLNELLAVGGGATVDIPPEAGASEHEILRFAQDDNCAQDDECSQERFEDDAFARDDEFRRFSEDCPQSKLFEAITRELLRSGNGIR